MNRFRRILGGALVALALLGAAAAQFPPGPYKAAGIIINQGPQAGVIIPDRPVAGIIIPGSLATDYPPGPYSPAA